VTFWQGIRFTYRDSFAFLLACPLLAAIPACFEMLQHGWEFHHGMFDSAAGYYAEADDHVRWILGIVKTVVFTIAPFWIIRFLATRDPAYAARVEGRAAWLFAPYVAWQVLFFGIGIFWQPSDQWALFAFSIGMQALNALLLSWGVAAALGNRAIGPLVSARITLRRLPWTLVFVIVASFPLSYLHKRLNGEAVERGLWVWAFLIIDSLLVSWYAAALVASNYFAAIRAATKAGLSLAGPGPAVSGATSGAPAERLVTR
jgi:hypothetical protein